MKHDRHWWVEFNSPQVWHTSFIPFSSFPSVGVLESLLGYVLAFRRLELASKLSCSGKPERFSSVAKLRCSRDTVSNSAESSVEGASVVFSKSSLSSWRSKFCSRLSVLLLCECKSTVFKISGVSASLAQLLWLTGSVGNLRNRRQHRSCWSRSDRRGG